MALLDLFTAGIKQEYLRKTLQKSFSLFSGLMGFPDQWQNFSVTENFKEQIFPIHRNYKPFSVGFSEKKNPGELSSLS